MTAPPKPPLGVEPREILDLKRYSDLCAAIGRYIVCGETPPLEWVNEARQLRRDHPDFD